MGFLLALLLAEKFQAVLEGVDVLLDAPQLQLLNAVGDGLGEVLGLFVGHVIKDVDYARHKLDYREC